MGGLHPAYDFVKACLENGKSVVTSNKELVAQKGAELLAIAQANNLNFLFEASVGGGIPIIGPMKHSLIANRIDSVMGIVNGTTNYMLTQMVNEGISYEEALAEAQEKGYAEADPSADVDGLDAAAKIAILASIAFNSRVTLDDVHAQGIRRITTTDLDAAHDMGYCVKLLAIAHRTEEGVDVRVHPTMIPATHQLAAVGGAFNAIYVTGDAVGETMFFGQGAGSGPTASAVMGDVLEVARHVEPSSDARAPTGCPSSRWRTCAPSTTSASPSPTARACSPRWRPCSRSTTSACTRWCSAACATATRSTSST